MNEEARTIIGKLRCAETELKEVGAAYFEEDDFGSTADLIEFLSAQLEQVTRERDAETELIGKLIVILKKYPNAATNGCAYKAYSEIKKWMLDMRGVEVE